MGYHCPEQVDFADYLEELPTNEGKRFRRSFSDGNHSETNPSNSSILQMHTTEAFVQAWKKSKIYQEMLSIMKQEDESVQSYVWPEVLKERYPGSFLFNTTASLARQVKFTIRDKTFLRVRIMQSLIVAAIAGSLFSDLAVTDTQTLLGILFFSSLFNALSSMSTLPIIYYQKSIFYKQSKAMFYPTLSFVISQTLVFYPLQIIEVILYSTIVYWSVGLSEDNYGGRFFTFIFILLSFSLCASQLFRMLASILPSEKIANPIGGILVILMVLFSGYIIPQKDIPDGWIWFYWINVSNYYCECNPYQWNC